MIPFPGVHAFLAGLSPGSTSGSRQCVLSVTPTVAQATYLVMELADDLLIGLFAAWRAEIDSLPFAHDVQYETPVRALLASRDRPGCETCP